MKIILSDRKLQKPLEKPIMIYPNKEESQLPDIYQAQLPSPKEKIIDISPSKQNKHNTYKFKILPEKFKTIKIIPNLSVKNDKTELFIDSFANNHKEIYQQLNKINIDLEKGISLPKQDTVFFEIKIGKDLFDIYISSNEHLNDFVKQQIGFTWKASIHDSECPFKNIDGGIGYEFYLKYPSGLALDIDGRFQEKPLREYLELSRMMNTNEYAIIQFGFQPAEKTWYKDAENSWNELSKRVNKTSKSERKITQNGFDCCLRLILIGEDHVHLDQLSRGFIMALKQLKGDNELIAKKVSQKRFPKWLNKKVKQRQVKSSIQHFSFNKRMLLCQSEIKNFIKLPQSNLQKDFNLQSNERDEYEVPKALSDRSGILIGHSKFKGREYPIYIPMKNLDSFMKSYIFCGSPRVGKDTAQSNLIIESAKKDCGAFIPDVIDEKGNDRGMADTIRDALPRNKIIDINLADYYNPVYFGLEDVAELIGENGMNVIADSFVKILGLEDTTSSQELCVMVAKACQCNIYKMYCFLRSKKFAKKIYEEIKEKDELLALEIKYEYLNNPKGLDTAIKTLKTRLKTILGNPHFKNMMAQEPNPDIKFEKWIRERKVVILRMNKMAIGEIGIQILMYLITMKIFWIKKIIQTNDCTFIPFNEPHQYMSNNWSELIGNMLVESPKYRLGLMFAFHHPKLLPEKLYSILLSSSINWFLFKNTNYLFYKQLEDQLKPITPEIAMKTKQYESIFMPFINGEQLDPLFVKMLPPPSHRQKMYSNESLTKLHVQKYGRPVNEVKDKIKAIELSMYEEGEKK